MAKGTKKKGDTKSPLQHFDESLPGRMKAADDEKASPVRYTSGEGEIQLQMEPWEDMEGVDGESDAS